MDNYRTKRTTEDVERADKRSLEDVEFLLAKTKRPLWKRLLIGVGQGVGIGVIVIGLAIGASSLTGSRTLAERADRNAAISVEGNKAIRCILTIKPNPEREFKKTQKLIDECYEDFDKLIGKEKGSYES